MKKSVELKIKSEQFTETLEPKGESFVRKLELEDSVEIVTEGTLYDKLNSRYIMYDESAEAGLADCRTLLKLTNAEGGEPRLRIRRFGGDDAEADALMDMSLEEGMVSITRFKIEGAGSCDLEISTNSIEDGLTEEGTGYIAADYRIKFDQIYSRRNKLRIEVISNG